MDAIDHPSIPKRLASWDFTIFWRRVLRPWEMLGAKHWTRKIQRISVSNGKLIYQLPTNQQKLEVPLVKSFPCSSSTRFPLDLRASSWWKCTCPSRSHHECSHSSAARWIRSQCLGDENVAGPRSYTNEFKTAGNPNFSLQICRSHNMLPLHFSIPSSVIMNTKV